jgi:hypothetical protein
MATVRVPAEKASEGVRALKVAGANASYEIAPLPDGRWAVKLRCEYTCGDMHAVSIPWRVGASREECLNFFLSQARDHFGTRFLGPSPQSGQKKAQAAMSRLLDEAKRFVEPVAVPRETKGEDVIATSRERERKRVAEELPLFADLYE